MVRNRNARLGAGTPGGRRLTDSVKNQKSLCTTAQLPPLVPSNSLVGEGRANAPCTFCTFVRVVFVFLKRSAVSARCIRPYSPRSMVLGKFEREMDDRRGGSVAESGRVWRPGADHAVVFGSGSTSTRPSASNSTWREKPQRRAVPTRGSVCAMATSTSYAWSSRIT